MASKATESLHIGVRVGLVSVSNLRAEKVFLWEENVMGTLEDNGPLAYRDKEEDKDDARQPERLWGAGTLIPHCVLLIKCFSDPEVSPAASPYLVGGKLPFLRVPAVKQC